MACCHRGPGALIRGGRASSSYVSHYWATRAAPPPPPCAQSAQSAASAPCAQSAPCAPSAPSARQDGAAAAATVGTDRQPRAGVNSTEQGSACGKKQSALLLLRQRRGGAGAGDLVGSKHRTDAWWSTRASLSPIRAFPGTAFLKPIASGMQQQQFQFARGYAADGDLPAHQEIGMPSLSPTMTQGNIAGWKKKEGDQVMAGDVLCEIETDKATIEMESMEEGYLAKIVVGDGAKDIKVGEIICIVVENEDDIPKFSNFKPSGGGGGQSAPPAKQEEEAPKEESAPPPPPPPSQSKPKSSPPPPQSKSSPPPSSSGDRIFASPAAKKLASDKNVPLDKIRGTGPDGHIVKGDIEDYLASGSSTQPEHSTGKAAPADSEGLDYSKISSNDLQKVTARRLVQSKQTIPHYYLTLDTRVDKILELQEQLNRSQEAAKREKLSVIDFVIKAAALATRKVPEVNSSWTEDAIRQYNNVNISVAIQSEQIVPVVKDADRKGLSAISEEVKVLVEKAHSNSLEPADYQGGTFAITYLGEEHGVKQFSAILHPPQSCVLAVGKTEKRVIPGLEAGQFVVGTYISVTMSCDHRVVDGAIGARWLGAFKDYIEDPMTLLL